MQARIVSAGRGARWLADGWRIFRAAPLGWIAAVLGYWLLMSILSIVPFIGAAAAALLVPAFTVGFMALARAAGRGAPLDLALLLEGFRHEPRAQLTLGAVYLAAVALVLGLSALADDGVLARWMLTGRRPEGETLPDELLGSFVAATALYTPVMLAFWFAPPLASWHGTGALKALFFSFAASLMNWRAFLAYGVVAAALTLVLPLALVTALGLVGGALPGAALVFPLLVLLLPTFFASFYASYRDVFGYDAAP